jgi:hypothetical protein
MVGRCRSFERLTSLFGCTKSLIRRLDAKRDASGQAIRLTGPNPRYLSQTILSVLRALVFQAEQMKKSVIFVVLLVAAIAVACGSSSGPKIEAGADLTRANLVDQNLSGRDLAGANLTSADLTGSDLSQANLRGANLTGANLTRTNLSAADLSGANLTSVTVEETDLTGANLIGATFDQVVLEKQKGGPTTTTTSTTTTVPEPVQAPPVAAAPAQQAPRTTSPPTTVRSIVKIEIREVSRSVSKPITYKCQRVYTYTDGYTSRESFTSPTPCK